MVIFSGITQKKCVKHRYTQSKAKIRAVSCARLRGHLSNSWALV